ncbi:MAG TPA: hypothetical protein VIH97_13455 [Candidatus Acidoferrales bacterium]|jgi:hypothetical protein
MIAINPQLILFSPNSSALEKLKPYSSTLPYISYEVGTGPEVTAKAKLDAVWMTPMVAFDLFGATPPFPLNRACVLRTPQAQLKKGFPRYGVAGVATSPNDAKNPEYNARLVMTALLEAIRDFNSRNEEQIIRIGILPEDLELTSLKPNTGFQIIREVYEAKTDK